MRAWVSAARTMIFDPRRIERQVRAAQCKANTRLRRRIERVNRESARSAGAAEQARKLERAAVGEARPEQG